jgi:hypothetical protein
MNSPWPGGVLPGRGTRLPLLVSGVEEQAGADGVCIEEAEAAVALTTHVLADLGMESLDPRPTSR